MVSMDASVLPPCQALALANYGTLITSEALADAQAALIRFKAHLRDADKHLAMERLRLASG